MAIGSARMRRSTNSTDYLKNIQNILTTHSWRFVQSFWHRNIASVRFIKPSPALFGFWSYLLTID